MKLTTIQLLLCGLALALGAAPARAQNQNWAEAMFDKLDLDFGVVARGADTRYRLTVTNKYAPTVHIASVRTTCGCTAAKPSKDTIASRDSAYIEITMDTKKFTHEKTSSVTVVIDQPQYAEVRIPIKAYIRTDVVLTPGGIEFGSVSRGSDAERKISVAYAGRDSWKIKNVINKNKNIEAKITETSRGSGRVNYDLLVTVKGTAPLGELRDQLMLVTDDGGNPNIPVLVEARVETEYTVTPALVDFGTVAPGATKKMNVAVRGKKPFLIEDIQSEKSEGLFSMELPKEAKVIQIFPITLNAPTEPGPLSEELTVKIAGHSEPVRFRVTGKVAASPTAGQRPAAAGEATTAQTNP